MTYRCILADPPWPEHGGGGRGAQNHYDIHNVEDIAKIMLSSPEWKPAESCHLWLWCPSRLHLAFELLDLLAIAYIQVGLFGKIQAVPRPIWRQVTFVPWVKCEQIEQELLSHLDDSQRWREAFVRQNPGLGQYIRHDSEILLFCTTGPAQVPEKAYHQQAILAPRTPEHSEKPDEQYPLIEHVSPGPRLEMFARTKRPGWTVWGNEV